MCATGCWAGSAARFTASTVNHPPGGGDFAGNNLAVAVTICQPQRTFFMNVVGFTSADVCARGVAAVATDSPNCIYALNPTEEKSLQVSSTEALLDSECGIVVNSQDPNGFYVDSCLKASSISVTSDTYFMNGTCDIPGFGDAIQPPPFTESPPEPDPLAHLVPPPMDPDCPRGTTLRARSTMTCRFHRRPTAAPYKYKAAPR